MFWYERIKALRISHNLSQEQIAKIIGTSQQYYGKYEMGKHKIPIDQLKKLCEFYGVSADEILGIQLK